MMSVDLRANELQVGRYSLMVAAPTEAQADLLATTTTTQFPDRIRTVGDAIRELLKRSGYRLAAVGSIGPDTIALFALPLPAVHRDLGPMTLRDALETLAGRAFRLVEDPVHRLIAFERCAADRFPSRSTVTNTELAVDRVTGAVDCRGSAGQAHSVSLKSVNPW